MTNASEKRTPNFLVLDEMSAYYGTNYDNFKEQIRSVEGIPNAEFVAIDDKVFVFEKLAQMVVEHITSHPDKTVVDLTKQLYPEAIVSAHEAVSNWNIVAVPYEKVQVAPNVLKIRHRIFNAFIPRTFNSSEEYVDAMVTLLLGKVVPGTGDINFRNQNFDLDYQYSVEALPPTPEMQLPAELVNPTSFMSLLNIEFVDGFSPIDKVQFDTIKKLEFDWAVFSEHVKSHTKAHIKDVWNCVLQLPLESLNDSENQIPEYDLDNATKLVALYPELNMLTPNTLYDLFDTYQLTIDMLNWDAYRSEEFVFYILRLINTTETVADVWAAYSLLQSTDLDTARVFSQTAIKYDQEIKSLASNTLVVMQFLAKYPKQVEQRGHEIVTFDDIFRRSRKINI